MGKLAKTKMWPPKTLFLQKSLMFALGGKTKHVISEPLWSEGEAGREGIILLANRGSRRPILHKTGLGLTRSAGRVNQRNESHCMNHP